MELLAPDHPLTLHPHQEANTFWCIYHGETFTVWYDRRKRCWRAPDHCLANCPRRAAEAYVRHHWQMEPYERG